LDHISTINRNSQQSTETKVFLDYLALGIASTCMENCPVFNARQFQGKEKKPIIILEAICDADLFIYFSFFGQPGSLNNPNILDKSNIVGAIFTQQLKVKATPFTINNNTCDWLYFLVAGIYPP
jgi:hypothetical protein